MNDSILKEMSSKPLFQFDMKADHLQKWDTLGLIHIFMLEIDYFHCHMWTEVEKMTFYNFENLTFGWPLCDLENGNLCSAM